MQLLQQNTPEDYVLRGYSQSEILEWTGFDVGYHGSKLKTVLKGIDRFDYKVLYVKTYYDTQQIQNVLNAYANGLDKEQVLRSLGIAGANIVKLKQLFTALGFADDFKEADKMQRTGSMKQGMVSKYGVDNAFKLSEYQEKAAQTREEKYGGRYTLSNESVLSDVARNTFEQHMQDDDFREDVSNKKKATNVAKYGSECVMNVDEIKQKVKETNLERYGVDHYMKTEDGRKQFGDRVKEHQHEYLEKSKQTCMEKYGVSNYMQTMYARKLQGQRMIANMDEIAVKRGKTMLARYGVEYPSQLPEAKERLSVRMKLHGDEYRLKARQTCIERYGVPYYMQTDEMRCKMSYRMLQPSVQTAILSAKQQNHTLNTSSCEEIFYQMLCSVFDVSDIERQYIDDRYPYACDFYIKSRDLFIELNATWTHGGHWYDKDNIDDQNKVTFWSKKDTKYYQNALQNWIQRDVDKRQAARHHQLNYVALWDAKLMDAMLWIGMGCPDGQDWHDMYSWLPKRDISIVFDYPELTTSDRCAIAVAKAANGAVFYQNEVQLWNENPMMRQWGTLQARLYANRFYYIKKLPDELYDKEILRGLSVSGLIRGYSVFQNTGMKEVLKKYDVHSVYDPCAGWGERLVTACVSDVAYFGCDINSDLQSGYQNIISQYDFQNCQVVYNDASKLDMTKHNHDCVFTCPPYENTEVYTSDGAENLSHDEFLVWWTQVVNHAISATTKVFAYQINTRYRDAMNQVLMNIGWKLQEQIPVGNQALSHMNRSQGRHFRKTWDEIQVFTIFNS